MQDRQKERQWTATGLTSVGVLYTSSGGLGHAGIIDAILSNGQRDVRILCGDVKKDPPVSFLHPYRQLPLIKSPGYVGQIADIAKEFGAQVVIPNHTDELILFAEQEDALRSSGIRVVVNRPDALKNSLDKGRCFSLVKQAGLPAPRYFQASTVDGLVKAAEELGYPDTKVCFKPSRHPHGGSRGFAVLDSTRKKGIFSTDRRPAENTMTLEEAAAIIATEQMPELLVMEYLPGEEYSAYLLCEDGKPAYCIPQLRQELMNSFSFRAEAVYNPKVIEAATSIAELLQLDYCVNIQLRMNGKGEPCLIEVNPRFAGALCLSAAAGVNMPYLAMMKALGNPVPRGLKIKWGTRMIRYWKEVFAGPGASR